MDLRSPVIWFRFCFGGCSRVRFRSHGLWYDSCSLVILSWCKGWFRVSVPLIIMILPFNFHVRAQGTSGSSVLSEESWLGSTGDGLLAPVDSVILFFSVPFAPLNGIPLFLYGFLLFGALPSTNAVFSLSGHCPLYGTER